MLKVVKSFNSSWPPVVTEGGSFEDLQGIVKSNIGKEHTRSKTMYNDRTLRAIFCGWIESVIACHSCAVFRDLPEAAILAALQLHVPHERPGS